MSRVIFPGSFDPFTIGHKEVVKQASRLFSEIVVLVSAHSSLKNHWFSLEERLLMVKASLKTIPQVVEVAPFDNLITQSSEVYESQGIIRGIRRESDLLDEWNYGLSNHHLSQQPIVFVPIFQFSGVSSSLVRQVLQYGKDIRLIESLVDKPVYEYLKNRNKT